MIDPNDPVQFLERTHREFQEIAGDHGGRTWTAREGQLLREDGMVMAECPLNAVAKLTASVLLAANGSPHAVLRRIDRERQILAECREILGVDGWEYDDAPNLADATIRNLAEAWGWTETPSTPDWPECMCTPSGECGKCWEKRQLAREMT